MDLNATLGLLGIAVLAALWALWAARKPRDIFGPLPWIVPEYVLIPAVLLSVMLLVHLIRLTGAPGG